VVAGACFILPATATTLAIAMAYVRFGALPQVSSFLVGVKPVITVVVVLALWRLGGTAIKSPLLGALTSRAVVLPRLRRSTVAGALLDGLNVASLALMATVTWALARAAIVDGRTVLIAAAGALGLALRVNSAWLALGGGVAGYLLAGP